MKKSGGVLEPVFKVSKYKYTVDPERIIWTQTFYPYAPYFLEMFNQIPWSDYRFEDKEHETTAYCNDVPYKILGGSALECYNLLLKGKVDDLNTLTDPTADVDVFLTPLTIKNKKGKADIASYNKHFTAWLFEKVVACFKSISYNFKEWFPHVDKHAPVVKTANSQLIDLEQAVGPFTICRNINEYNDCNVQVFLSINGNSDHIMEITLWNSDSDVILSESQIAKDYSLDLVEYYKGLILSPIIIELSNNCDAIMERYNLKEDKISYKYYNHLYRNKFILSVCEYYYKDSNNTKLKKLIISRIKRNLNNTLEFMLKTDVDDAKIIYSHIPDIFRQYINKMGEGGSAKKKQTKKTLKKRKIR